MKSELYRMFTFALEQGIDPRLVKHQLQSWLDYTPNPETGHLNGHGNIVPLFQQGETRTEIRSIEVQEIIEKIAIIINSDIDIARLVLDIVQVEIAPFIRKKAAKR